MRKNLYFYSDYLNQINQLGKDEKELKKKLKIKNNITFEN